jgi:hypothetical protein
MGSRLLAGVVAFLLLVGIAGGLAVPFIAPIFDEDRCLSVDTESGAIDDDGAKPEQRTSIWPLGFTCYTESHEVTRFHSVGPSWLEPLQVALVGLGLVVLAVALALGLRGHGRRNGLLPG